MFFLKEFYSKKIKQCSIVESRKKLEDGNNKNLIYLLENRLLWMKKFIKNKKYIIELGCGNGATKKILNNNRIILTDIQKYPWISKKVDMTKLIFKKNRRFHNKSCITSLSKSCKTN